MIFWLVGTIVFDTFWSLYFAQKCSVAPFPAILTLEDTWVHIGSSNGRNVPANIEASIDKHFGFDTTLNILYVYPDDEHVQFGWNLDNS